ncbi:hypothetical protein ACW7EJ_17040, partial [Acinetobacter soli]
MLSVDDSSWFSNITRSCSMSKKIFQPPESNRSETINRSYNLSPIRVSVKSSPISSITSTLKTELGPVLRLLLKGAAQGVKTGELVEVTELSEGVIREQADWL